MAGDCAKIGRAEKDGDFVLVVSALDRKMQAESGKIKRRFPNPVSQGRVAVFKHVGGKSEFFRFAVIHNVDSDQTVIKQAGVKELRLELRAFTPPQGTLRAETDFSPLIVADIKQKGGHLSVRVFKGSACQRTGFGFHVRHAEIGQKRGALQRFVRSVPRRFRRANRLRLCGCGARGS